MIFRSTKIQSSVIQIAALIILNALILLHIPFVSGFAGFAFLFLLPGFFLVDFLRLEYKCFWPRLVHIVALSVVFVLLGGLFTNTIIPLLVGNYHPLAFGYILFTFDVYLIALGLFNYFFRKTTIHFHKRSISFEELWPHLLLLLFPIVAVMGATILNNGGSNWLTICLITSIVVFVISLFVTKREIPESFWQSSLYFIALALLLMTSMRGWHITGYDIQQEFQVFQMTKNSLFWTMAHLQDPYNACLSITILPTIVSRFIHLPDEYIYKFLSQFIFALISVAVFLLTRILGDKKTAFLATLFFIGQVSFFQGMPTLIRQEFGMLFFVMILLTLFDTVISKATKYNLAMLYGLGMVMSHYSTSYIAVILLLLACGMNIILDIVIHHKKDDTNPHKITKNITLSYAIFLLVTVLVWNTLITHTSGNFVRFVDQSSSSIDRAFSSDAITSAMNQILYPYPRAQQVDLSMHIYEDTKKFRQNWSILEFYSDESIVAQHMENVTFQKVPAHFGNAVAYITSLLFKVLKILINDVLILAGVFALCYRWVKKDYGNSEFLLLSLSGFILLASLLLIPQALKEYNLERLYFQLLTLWAFAGVYGGWAMTKFIKNIRVRFLTLALVYCLQLLFYSGVVFNFSGGAPLLGVENYGEDYEKFYTHSADVAAAQWLGNVYGRSLIYTNSPGYNNLLAFGNVNKYDVVQDTLPSVMSVKSYVFANYINTIGTKGLYSENGDQYAFTYPLQFLDANKDEIYSNGISKIYR